MLFAIIATMVWLPSILGLGAALLSLGAFRPHRAHGWVFLTVAGLVALGTAANIVNFFAPVGPHEALSFLFAGWLAFMWAVRKGFIERPCLPFAALSLALLVYIAWAGRAFVFWNDDSGLYHVPTITWLTQSKIVLGLGNLHGRLAFNQLWLSASAALEIPLLRDRSSFVLSTILLFGYGLSLLQTVLNAVRKPLAASDVFFLATGLLWFNLINGARLNSPSPDIPTMLLVLLTTFAVMKAMESRSDWAYYGFLTSVLAISAITIKLSALPLALAPLVLMIWGVLQKGSLRASPHLTAFARPAIIVGLLLFIPWILRGIALSGCLAYPLTTTRIPYLDWAIPVSDIQNEAAWIQSWARHPSKNPGVVLASWDWLWDWWLARYKSDRTVVATALMVIVGVIAGVSTYLTMPFSRLGLTRFLLSVLLPTFSLVFWFFSAPDMRFGEGYFWALGLLVMVAGLHRAYRIYASAWLSKLRPSFVMLLAMLAIIAPVVISMPSRLAFWANSYQPGGSTLAEIVFSVPPLPEVSTESLLTEENNTVYIPKRLGLCWNSTQPCTPSFRKDLKAVIGSDGLPVKFYFEK